jgi:hypothetical protein
MSIAAISSSVPVLPQAESAEGVHSCTGNQLLRRPTLFRSALQVTNPQALAMPTTTVTVTKYKADLPTKARVVRPERLMVQVLFFARCHRIASLVPAKSGFRQVESFTSN